MATLYMNDDSTQICVSTHHKVELRGLEPLTSSMPWWPEMHRRRAASLDEVHGRAGATTCIQPRSPSVCPPWLEPQPRQSELPFSAWEDVRALGRQRTRACDVR